MGKIKLGVASGSAIFAFCLLLLSNYVGNVLIPTNKVNDVDEFIAHDWIKWPKPIITMTIPETTNESEKTDKVDTQISDIKKELSSSTESFAILLLSEDVIRGKKIARKCVACHSFKKGGKNKIGPNLYEIMGRQRGLPNGYNYSKALKKMGGTWGYNDMDKFLLKPREFMPGTKMSFKGIKNARDRAAMILYLRSFSDSPVPLPK
jgi:cytochrome c